MFWTGGGVGTGDGERFEAERGSDFVVLFNGERIRHFEESEVRLVKRSEETEVRCARCAVEVGLTETVMKLDAAQRIKAPRQVLITSAHYPQYSKAASHRA